MKLYVIRHGEAEDPGPGRPDEARRLTPEGREELARGAAGLRALGVRLDRIFTSPLVRAQETARILARELAGPTPEVLEALAPGAALEDVLRAVHGAGEHVAVVGHEPGLGGLVSLSLYARATDATPLRKGGAACLRFAAGTRPGGAMLAWLLTPKQLRAIR